MRRLRTPLALGLPASALLAVSPAGAGSSAGHIYRFRVIAATHSSSSQKNEAPIYTGSSSASWHLPAATSRAPNAISITIAPGFVTGIGYVNIKGVFNAQATTNRTTGTVS